MSRRLADGCSRRNVRIRFARFWLAPFRSGGFLVVFWWFLVASWVVSRRSWVVSRSPGPPNPDQEPRAGLELRLRQARLRATSDHVYGPGPHPLDVLQQVHRLRQQRIARERLVRQAQLVHGQGRRQPARIHDLKPVREQHHLNGCCCPYSPRWATAFTIASVTTSFGISYSTGACTLSALVPTDSAILLRTKSTAWSTSENTVPL